MHEPQSDHPSTAVMPFPYIIHNSQGQGYTK